MFDGEPGLVDVRSPGEHPNADACGYQHVNPFGGDTNRNAGHDRATDRNHAGRPAHLHASADGHTDQYTGPADVHAHADKHIHARANPTTASVAPGRIRRAADRTATAADERATTPTIGRRRG